MSAPKRVMVDMSATLIHHGHVRILKSAAELGRVIVALTIDEDVLLRKGYDPELDYAARKEVLESIRYVAEVVPSPWMLDDAFLDEHRIDLLVHGTDNSNLIRPERLLILPRTKGVSSSLLRARVLDAVSNVLKRDKAE